MRPIGLVLACLAFALVVACECPPPPAPIPDAGPSTTSSTGSALDCGNAWPCASHADCDPSMRCDGACCVPALRPGDACSEDRACCTHVCDAGTCSEQVVDVESNC